MFNELYPSGERSTTNDAIIYTQNHLLLLI